MLSENSNFQKSIGTIGPVLSPVRLKKAKSSLVEWHVDSKQNVD